MGGRINGGLKPHGKEGLRAWVMNRKVVIVKALEAIAMPLIVFLVILLSPSISRATYNRIQLGMTEEEVAAIIPVDPIGSRNGTIWSLALGDHTKAEIEGDWLLLRRAGNVKYVKSWLIDTAYISIGFDVNGRVFAKQFMPLRSAKTSWLDKVIAWFQGK
jgi:hypothetical protein